jgi:hypothetical protein
LNPGFVAVGLFLATLPLEVAKNSHSQEQHNNNNVFHKKSG